jgi:hypothetical protein
MTRIRMLPLLLFMAVFLAACRGSGEQASLAPTATTQAMLPPTWTPAPTARPGCTVVSTSSPENNQVMELLGEVNENDWVKGSQEASVTILEYSDFQ